MIFLNDHEAPSYSLANSLKLRISVNRLRFQFLYINAPSKLNNAIRA